MNAKDRTKQHFNETASEYNSSGNGKFVAPMYEDLLNEIGKIPGGKLLDIGCGNGNLFNCIQDKKYELYGVDFAEKMISEAKINCGEKALFFTADAEKLPFDDNTFDILTCNASFHHYIHPDAVLKEMCRVLKKGGTLIIGEPYIPAIFRPLMNVLIKFSTEGDYHFYGLKEMKRILIKNGFSPLSSERTGEHTALHTAHKI